MKKILVLAYLRNNLGDDLFVRELINRYPNVEFYVRVIDEKYATPFIDLPNMKTVEIKNEMFKDISVNEYDGYIYIGGSIFMEGGKVYNLDNDCYEFMKKCKELEKPFYYISSNYGPYQTNEYFELSKKVFETCTDICFRDKYSYDLFKKIETVRYAPDLVFSYPIGKIDTIKNTVGISLIDLEIREDIKQKEQEYIQFMVENIKKYILKGMKIYLFSFCRYEGDEKMIEKLKQKLPQEFEQGKIQIVKYENNIQEFLRIYKSMEYMICERFHSLILSYVCRQKFFVISYSNKINNIIKELDLCDSFLNFKDIKQNENLDLDNFKEVDVEKLTYLREEAENQFKKVDEYLKY